MTAATTPTDDAVSEPPIEYLPYRKARRTDDLGFISDRETYTTLDELLAEAAEIPSTDVRNHIAYVVRDTDLQELLREAFGHDMCDTCRELGTLTVVFSDLKVMLGHDVERRPW